MNTDQATKMNLAREVIALKRAGHHDLAKQVQEQLNALGQPQALDEAQGEGGGDAE